jgi:2-hydroxychromene-2-carboxylate isomerase
LARLKGVFKLPPRHPKVGQPAIRAFYHIERTDPNAAARLAKTHHHRLDDLDTVDPVAIAQHASLLSLDRDMMLAGVTGSEVKAIARRYGEAAAARGVFGSPWIFVEDEPFWGSDRLAMVEKWLANGPY